MKKTNATLVCIALIIIAAFSWIGVLKRGVDNASNYEKYIQQAEKYEQKGIFIDALTCYQEAQKIRPKEYDVAVKIAKTYEKLGDTKGFLMACDEASSLNKDTSEPYVMKAEYLINTNRYADAIKAVNGVPKKLEEADEIQHIKELLAYQYNIKYVSFDDIYDWHEAGGKCYAAAKNDGFWGLVDEDGNQKLRFRFDYVGAYDEETGVVPCCENGAYYYVDIKGNKKLAGDFDYQFLGSFGCGYAPAQRNNTYGYINAEFEEFSFDYSYAGAFANKVAAVEKNGKWALINERFEPITDFMYDEIFVDAYGYCSVFKTIVARIGSGFVLLDTEGKRISERTFESVSLPASEDEPIAVKIGGYWSYVDTTGNVVLDTQFDNAKSFALGLAPVQKNNKWVYINTQGKIVSKDEFADASVFSHLGLASVKGSHTWNIIALCEYEA